MGKLCSVKSCPSGRKKKNKKNAKPQHLSFFRPTTAAKLEKWNSALGTKMKTTDYICHLHFKEEDIKMYETFNIKGEIMVLPTGKKLLRDDAVPTVEHQFVPVSKLTHELKTNIVHTSPNDSESEEMEELEILNSEEEEEEPELLSKLEEKFLENIKSSLLPPGWTYFERDEGLVFLRMDSTMKVLNRIRVNKDLSVTVIFPTEEELTVDDNICAYSSISEYLLTVQRWPICVGTQIDRRKFSQNCKGVIVGEESYKRNQMNTRCKACRVLRHRLMSRRARTRTRTGAGGAGGHEELCLRRTESPESVSYPRPSLLQIKSIHNYCSPELDVKVERIELEVKDELDTKDEAESFDILKVEELENAEKEPKTKSKQKIILERNKSVKVSTDEADLEENVNFDTEILYEYDECEDAFISDVEMEELEENDVTVPIKKKQKLSEEPQEKLQCVECGKVFKTKKTYSDHLKVVHEGHNRRPCPRCGKIYRWRSSLERHLRGHKARDAGELYCAACDKAFASVDTYRKHLRVSRRHVDEEDFNFMCNECGKKFVNKTLLRDHIDWEHLNNIKFRCQLCDKPYKCHTTLYMHMQNVHLNEEKNLCDVCGKSYQNPDRLKRHILAMHSAEKPYHCAVCGAAFGWYSSLYRHVREVHHKIKFRRKKQEKTKKTKKMKAESELSN